MNMDIIAPGVAMWIALGLFAGAVGKSGQFPLHTWLPDAMEGPTPVSSLIHAATMVAAGVFLVARFFPVFEASEIALNTVAIIGGITAVLAATMGLVMNDIKRVLAYSTVSQLGYMMLALGVGAPGGGDFPSVYARLLQVPAVHGCGQRQPRDGRHVRHEVYGRSARSYAMDVHHVPDWEPEPRGDISAGRFLEQG